MKNTEDGFKSILKCQLVNYIYHEILYKEVTDEMVNDIFNHIVKYKITPMSSIEINGKIIIKPEFLIAMQEMYDATER